LNHDNLQVEQEKTKLSKKEQIFAIVVSVVISVIICLFLFETLISRAWDEYE